MTSRFRFLSSPRPILKTVALLLLVFTLCAAASDAYGQPPRRQGGDNNAGRGGRRDSSGDNNSSRGGRRDSGGDNNSGRGTRGGRPGFPGGGFPGGGFPGMPGQPGQPGQPDQGGQGGQPDQQQQQQQPQPERKVDLDTALDNSLGTVPIRLNQDAFRTRDGARLTGTYLKGKGDKDTPVVILIPGLNMEEGTYNSLGQLLAQQGFAVLIPDLRGRNQNQNQNQNQNPQNTDNNPPNDTQQAKERASREPSNAEIAAMINTDREVWFNFLFHVNDKGLCNVKKTIIVGSEFSAALACAWAKNDWSVKGEMGQNVVGLALLSPDAVDDKKKDKDEAGQSTAKKYDCLSSLESVHKVAKGKTFGYLVIAGVNAEDKRDAAQLIQKKIGGARDEQAKPQDKVVLFYALQTSMQGTQLLGLESMNVPATIGQFVAKRMQELPKKRDKWAPINEDLSKEDK